MLNMLLLLLYLVFNVVFDEVLVEKGCYCVWIVWVGEYFWWGDWLRYVGFHGGDDLANTGEVVRMLKHE